MATIEIRQGDIFKEDVEAIVNTVNCEGVMGKGLALQFKKRFPENFKRYAQTCKNEEVQIGKMFVSKVDAQLSLFDRPHSSDEDTDPERSPGLRWIINFPTKKGWRQSSRLEDVEEGLQDLVRVIREKHIESIAIPALGCDLGGLDWEHVEPKIKNAIEPINELRAVLLQPRDMR